MTPDERANLLRLAASADLAHRLQAVEFLRSMQVPTRRHYPGWWAIAERSAWLRHDGAAAYRLDASKTQVVLPGGYRRTLATRHGIIGSVDYLEQQERYEGAR